MPINVKEAVYAAKKTLQELFDDEPLKALALEEIELIKDSKHECWAVTLGFYRSRSVNVTSSALAILQPATQVEQRVYKTVLIDAETGEFVKMDMRII